MYDYLHAISFLTFAAGSSSKFFLAYTLPIFFGDIVFFYQ